MKLQRNRKSGRIVVALFTTLMLFGLAAAVLAEGEFATVDTDQLNEMIAQNQYFILIDARTPQEYEEAHIKDAISIPDKEFQKKTSLLPEDKSAPLVIYCNGIQCGKSKRLAEQIGPLGYRNIMIYAEGFPMWEEKALPIVAGPEYGKKIETTKIKPADLKRMIDEKKTDFVLVDTRDPAEFMEGHIPAAINISAEKFASGSGALPKEKKIIVYCNTGSRSYLAYRKLVSLSYPDIYQTLFADWKDAGMPIEK